MPQPNPLVSVGIPTYNRPEGLRETLLYITKQTYKNLEIVVSDNASTSPETERIVHEFMNHDHRIRYYRQSVNTGMAANFQFVLEKSTGEYFTWAADDDKWESNFIERIISEFQNSDSSIVAINTEAQYIVDDKLQHFFSEGKMFYEKYGHNTSERILHILRNCYGNLAYSIFRRICLFKQEKSFFCFTNNQSLNEIPLLIFVSQYGQFKILPEVLFYKSTNINTYQQARWELEGGRIPFRNCILNINEMESTIGYHKNVFYDVAKMLRHIDLKEEDVIKIETVLFEGLSKHAINLIFSEKLLNVEF